MSEQEKAGLFICTGRGDPRHGTAACEDDSDGGRVWDPGQRPPRTASVVRCPVCGRRERIGGRRMDGYMRAVLAGLITQVDISKLHR